jgi:peptidoglycan/LPS O-acetylase OafA/YrhL
VASASVRSKLSELAEIRPMTGVRGIAAISVVADHFFDDPSAASRPWQHAYLAVDLFFMLSGLVLALNYASTVTLGAGRQTYLDFVKRRIARVFPLYITVTVLHILYDLGRHVGLGIALPDTWEPKAMFANLLLIQSWGFSRSIVGPAWSLSTELAAYLLFPILVALAIQTKPVLAWGVALLSGALLLAAAFGNVGCTDCGGFLDIFHGYTPYPLMRCVAGFVFGLIGYRLVHQPRIRALVSSSLFAVLAVLAVVATYCAGYQDLVVYVFLFATVIACFGNSTAANLMFGNRVVFFFGKISFSIYLVHIFLSPVVNRVVALDDAHFGRLAGLVSATFAFAAVFAASTVFYYLVEMPGRRFMMKLMSPKKRTVAGASAAPASPSVNKVDPT